MKIRTDFVTNSSSASYIALFAKISDEDKASRVLSEYSGYVNIYTAQEVLSYLRSNPYWLNFWCYRSVDVAPSKEYIESEMSKNPDVRFITVESYSGDNHPDYDEDIDIYSWDPGVESHPDKIVSLVYEITEDNGFEDIDYQRGYGFDG